MKNNKGFISITVIYSFFLVFLSLMMFIVVNMVSTRNLLNNMKTTIKNDISDSNFANYLLNRRSEINLKKIDNSYRYTGANPNNYIKFNNENYRIIGIIDGSVKIIKGTAISNIAWDTNNQNTYSSSSLNTYLNSTFKNSLGTNINLIDTTAWYVGGLDSSYKSKTGDVIVKDELSNNGVVVNEHIAIPYIRDYIYASGGTTITKTNNWLFTSNMWFITRMSTTILNSYYLTSTGAIDYTDIVSITKNIKPCFYLKGSVKYISGSGTNSDPYIVG